MSLCLHIKLLLWQVSCLNPILVLNICFAAKIMTRTAFCHKTWVFDTGASDHIACSMTLLHSITSITNYIVELPNGESA